MRHVSLVLNTVSAIGALGIGFVYVWPVAHLVLAGISLTGLDHNMVGPALVALILAPSLLIGITNALFRATAMVIVALACSGLAQGLRLADQGSFDMALAIGGGLIFVSLGWVAWIRIASGMKRRDVALLVQALCTLTAEITDQLRRRYAGAPAAHRPSGPLAQVYSMEREVLMIITDALVEPDLVRFASVVAEGLADLKHAASLNRRRDSEGYGESVASEFAGRLHAELRDRVLHTPALDRIADYQEGTSAA